MNAKLTEFYRWVKWVMTGALPSPPLCSVCGDELHEETEILHRHCGSCWPAAFRSGPPIKTRAILLGNEPDQRLGKAVR